MRTFAVEPGVVPTWDGITPAGEVVARFLAFVRTTGDRHAARRLMAPAVPAHQVVAEAPQTVVRTPEEYAAHVGDMLATHGRFAFEVTELLADGDRVYVRWRQRGAGPARGPDGRASGTPVTEVGSAVYRVHEGRIAEYWVQLDRLGLLSQLE
jgi:ketosteroid isomerase-like protein